MNFTFEVSSIEVETHVHRVLNRSVIVRTKARVETADMASEIVPDKYRKHVYEWLIQHGIMICTKEAKLQGLCIYGLWRGTIRTLLLSEFIHEFASSLLPYSLSKVSEESEIRKDDESL